MLHPSPMACNRSSSDSCTWLAWFSCSFARCPRDLGRSHSLCIAPRYVAVYERHVRLELTHCPRGLRILLDSFCPPCFHHVQPTALQSPSLVEYASASPKAVLRVPEGSYRARGGRTSLTPLDSACEVPFLLAQSLLDLVTSWWSHDRHSSRVCSLADLLLNDCMLPQLAISNQTRRVSASLYSDHGFATSMARSCPTLVPAVPSACEGGLFRVVGICRRRSRIACLEVPRYLPLQVRHRPRLHTSRAYSTPSCL